MQKYNIYTEVKIYNYSTILIFVSTSIIIRSFVLNKSKF